MRWFLPCPNISSVSLLAIKSLERTRRTHTQRYLYFLRAPRHLLLFYTLSEIPLLLWCEFAKEGI
jgi:hypothetical protein